MLKMKIDEYKTVNGEDFLFIMKLNGHRHVIDFLEDTPPNVVANKLRRLAQQIETQISKDKSYEPRANPRSL